MEPLKPDTKTRILRERPQASPEDLEEYERLLAERFTEGPGHVEIPGRCSGGCETGEASGAFVHEALRTRHENGDVVHTARGRPRRERYDGDGDPSRTRAGHGCSIPACSSGRHGSRLARLLGSDLRTASLADALDARYGFFGSASSTGAKEAGGPERAGPAPPPPSKNK